MADKINNILIPNITQLPKKDNAVSNKLPSEGKSEFKELFDKSVDNDLSLRREEGSIKLSIHAAKRLSDRNISVDKDEYLKLKTAMERLKNKGGQDSLIVTNKAAYIVDIKNNTVVTAVDRQGLSENVFTKIDSSVFMD